jgi:hypothetical protein
MGTHNPGQSTQSAARSVVPRVRGPQYPTKHKAATALNEILVDLALLCVTTRKRWPARRLRDPAYGHVEAGLAPVSSRLGEPSQHVRTGSDESAFFRFRVLSYHSVPMLSFDDSGTSPTNDSPTWGEHVASRNFYRSSHCRRHHQFGVTRLLVTGRRSMLHGQFRRLRALSATGWYAAVQCHCPVRGR